MNEITRKVLHSSNSDEWSTPIDFYSKLDSIFQFTLDPCATDENHKCDKYYTIEDDGLSECWTGERVFVNPPYSENSRWLEKCYSESRSADTVVVALIPSRTDTRYWHNYAMKATHIYFVKGRLKFGEQKNSAPFPSAVLVFNNLSDGQPPNVSTMERR